LNGIAKPVPNVVKESLSLLAMTDFHGIAAALRASQ